MQARGAGGIYVWDVPPALVFFVWGEGNGVAPRESKAEGHQVKAPRTVATPAPGDASLGFRSSNCRRFFMR